MVFSNRVLDTCPRCHRQVLMLFEFEPHPSNQNLALQNFTCPSCGPVRTKILSMKVGAGDNPDEPESR